jgi:2,4'-dihydroxyacetophenone dioxygenase
VAHTINGAWRYKENDWVARAGDTVYEVAGSSHTPEAFEDTEMFIYMIGELLFLDQDNKLLWQENHKTSIERYTRYCADNGIPARGLTRWDA